MKANHPELPSRLKKPPWTDIGLDHPGACQALRAVRWRKDLTSGKVSIQRLYFVTGPPIGAASGTESAGWIRGHRKIENQLHHVRNTPYTEDASRPLNHLTNRTDRLHAKPLTSEGPQNPTVGVIFVTDGRAWPALGNVSLFRRTTAAQKLVHVGELSAEPPAPHRPERMRIRRVALPLVRQRPSARLHLPDPPGRLTATKVA
ncbi:hypothetical protein GCM10010400_41350 [Streptomyces aculeolatus]|uniref:hypothetical protein n=1 Tax=Streptomyces aculeolatus TaxID=270689 RepID=UPI001CECAE7D|nr:hypothetical protein [Streptomyces aculeolatus]